nr:MAG TPA: hypothetical protein [Bacteriophage sp.]DAN23565.1 MAG TPA_asm: hypothetical protein [Bacteriophage sp.]DAP66428.1 MAG TPA: hypothetical protein [Caudoviricetes sp.]
MLYPYLVASILEPVPLVGIFISRPLSREYV